MQIFQIKICDLPAYIESPGYKNSRVLPITRARAISQFNNPDASPEDVALLIAINEQEEITGYIGILPGKVKINGIEEKIFWNSGWWIDAEKGRNASMFLFYKMIEVCKNRIVIADLTEHTTKILSYSGFFEMPQTQKGIRGFFRFSLSKILPNKFAILNKVYGALAITDTILNLLIIPYNLYKQLRFNLPKNYSFSIKDEIDEECSVFINLLHNNAVYFRNAIEISWIIKHPWLREGNKNQDVEAQRYYFSTVSKQFQNICLKIRKENIVVACIILTNRDNEYKMPYYFCLHEEMNSVAKILVHIMLKNKAISFTTWQNYFVDYLSKQSPFLMKKEVYKQGAYSKALSSIFKSGFNLQDGDGDMAFT